MSLNRCFFVFSVIARIQNFSYSEFLPPDSRAVAAYPPPYLLLVIEVLRKHTLESCYKDSHCEVESAWFECGLYEGVIYRLCSESIFVRCDSFPSWVFCGDFMSTRSDYLILIHGLFLSYALPLEAIYSISFTAEQRREHEGALTSLGKIVMLPDPIHGNGALSPYICQRVRGNRLEVESCA